MEKSREELSKKIEELEHAVTDLRNQNEQLQYKNEYNSDPMLLERLQDVTDMKYAHHPLKILCWI